MADLAEVLDPSNRINWLKYSDEEMFQIAVWADRYGHVGLLRKVQKATLRRSLSRSGS